MFLKPLSKLMIAAAAFPALVAGQAYAGEDGDGFPHIAIAQEVSGELELEFEIEVGLVDDGINTPTINLVAPQFSNFFGGYQTVPLVPTAFANSDLGFVSEVEGEEEGGAINGDIIVRMLTKDANFEAWIDGVELFTDAAPNFALGNQFDRHPTWVVTSPEGSLTSASASFEVFDVTAGSIGSGAESLGTFDVVITAVPEPGSAVALLLGAGLIASRRRRK